jgi:hypothetical protein
MIGELEKLLAQEVGKAKATASLAKDYKRQREENSRLKQVGCRAGELPAQAGGLQTLWAPQASPGRTRFYGAA